MTSDDQVIRDGRAVSNWAENYGSILGRTTEAHTAAVAATGRAIEAPGPATFDVLRAAGRNLAAVCTDALATPFTGVSDIDNPRRAALEMYREAGLLIENATLGIDRMDADLTRAAALLTDGTTTLHQSTVATDTLTQQLVAYVRKHNR